MADPRGAHPVRVFLARSMTEARLAVAFLGDRGIAARVEDAHTHEAFRGVERILDQKGGVGVAVSSEQEEAAEAAIREFARPAGGGDDEDAAPDPLRDEE